MLLKSGKELKITVAPFAISRALLQALLEEAKGVKLDPKSEVDVNLFKDLFCTALSSKKVEAALEECMKRATYEGVKISADTFEAEEARGDYFEVCLEVAKANVLPFGKSLSAQFADIRETLRSALS